MRLVHILFFLCILSATLGQIAYGQHMPQAEYNLYLPLATNRERQTPPPPPPPPVDGASFVPGEAPTRGFDAAYDGRGGLHMSYIRYSQQQNGQTIEYAYCPPAAACDNFASWTTISVAQGTFGGTQIEVTSDGRPRLFYESDYTLSSANIVYAECNATCTNPASWGSLALTTEPVEYPTVATVDSTRRDWFQLNPQGASRAVVPTRGGAYYITCDNGCLNDANWSVTMLRPEPDEYANQILYWPVLRYSSDGRAHLLAQGGMLNATYFTCARACEQAESWEKLVLSNNYNSGNPNLMDVVPTAWDLEIDPNDRLVVAAGGYQASNPNAFKMALWACATDCSNLANWGGFENQITSQGLDLGINRAGVPYFMLIGKRAADSEGITIVAHCIDTSNCYRPNAQWTDQVVDTQTAMESQWPVILNLPAACARLTFEWSNDAGRLLFDSANNVRLFATGTASATCLSGYAVERDPWGVIRTGRGVDIWTFMVKARLVVI
jgi:hypothetical protein